MEAAFYSVDANPDLRGVRLPESNEVDIDTFIEKLKTASPEKIAILAELMKSSL